MCTECLQRRLDAQEQKLDNQFEMIKRMGRILELHQLMLGEMGLRLEMDGETNAG